MKRYGILLLLYICTLGTDGIRAQDMKTLFIQMPDSCIPLLETAWRKDLVDLYLAGKEARLENMMHGYSKLLKLTDDYLQIQVTARSYLQMKKLPLINNTHIICVTTTVGGPVMDSRVAFYTTLWQPLEASALFTPVTRGWFLVDDADQESDAYKDALALLDIDLITYSLSPGNFTLTAVYLTPSYLNKQEREKIIPFLKTDNKVYTWDKSSFR
jgi:hypothetical protein